MSSVGRMNPFDAVDLTAWREQVAAELQGQEPATLNYDVALPFPIEALYTERPSNGAEAPPGTAPFLRGPDLTQERKHWRACARVEVPGDAAAWVDVTGSIARDVIGPIDAIWLDATAPASFGEEIPPGFLPVLHLLDLSRTSVALNLGLSTRAAATYLLDRAERTAAPLTLEARLDPLEAWARGELESPDAMTAQVVAMAQSFTQKLDGTQSSSLSLRAGTISSLAYHDAGADPVTELAYAVASGSWLLGELSAGGLPLSSAALQSTFVTATGPLIFVELAKLRALRGLWTRLQEEHGIRELVPARIHAITSWRSLSARDPWINLMRATESAWSAALGGADWITVRAFDEPTFARSELGQRLARNLHAILANEAGLADVADPAGGSFAVESLTTNLVDRAWREYEAIEERGGMFEEIASGRVAAHLGDCWSRRERELRKRRLPVTGVSEFPLGGEPLADAGRVEDATSTQGLVRHRDADPFEALRARADRLALRTGAPRIHLVALGSRRDFGPRLEFVKNLFVAGGFGTTEGAGTEGVDPANIPRHVHDEFENSGAWMACLCGSAAAYAELVAPAALALHAAGATVVVLAGKPDAERDRDSIDLHVYLGMDVVAALDQLLAHEEQAAVHGPGNGRSTHASRGAPAASELGGSIRHAGKSGDAPIGDSN